MLSLAIRSSRTAERIGVRFISATAYQMSMYKDWKGLTKEDKQSFIYKYIDLYKEKYPCSKSNVMYRSLAEGMEEHDDTPYVFGVIYNELRSVAHGDSRDNKTGQGIMGDPIFKRLLIQ